MTKIDEWRKLATSCFEAVEVTISNETVTVQALRPWLTSSWKALREACDRIEALEANLEAERQSHLIDNRKFLAEFEALEARLAAAEMVCEAADSAASEDSVREELLAYNMGLELIQRLKSWTGPR